jgi:formate hydrogenlyase subunit 6/NADH:ubiquinone oxidoreductase subunit I
VLIYITYFEFVSESVKEGIKGNVAMKNQITIVCFGCGKCVNACPIDEKKKEWFEHGFVQFHDQG